MVTHSSMLAWEIPWMEEPGGYSPWGDTELDMTEHAHTHGVHMGSRLLSSEKIRFFPVSCPCAHHLS